MNEPTWGISGPTFLWLYAAAFLVTACGVWLRRKGLLNAQDGRAPSATPDVYELAMLNGGPQLAITIAIAKLHRLGALVAGSGKKIRTAGRPKSTATSPTSTTRSTTPSSARRGSPRASSSASSPAPRPSRRSRRSSPTRACCSTTRRARRSTGRWLLFLPVIGLGAARVVAGIQNERPVAFIVIAVCAVAFVTIMVALQAPPRDGARPGAPGRPARRPQDARPHPGRRGDPAGRRAVRRAARCGRPIPAWPRRSRSRASARRGRAAAAAAAARAAAAAACGGGGGGCGGGGCGGG